MKKENKYILETTHGKERVMKKIYEEPLCEEMLLLTESVMLVSGEEGEEEPEEEYIDNQERDHNVHLSMLL